MSNRVSSRHLEGHSVSWYLHPGPEGCRSQTDETVRRRTDPNSLLQTTLCLQRGGTSSSYGNDHTQGSPLFFFQSKTSFTDRASGRVVHSHCRGTSVDPGRGRDKKRDKVTRQVYRGEKGKFRREVVNKRTPL